MDKAGFWTLIEANFDANCEQHNENLKAALLKMSPDEIAECQRLFDEHEATLYRWDLWGVAFVIGGGCSDDGFSDFREMIIRRGQKFYQAMLLNPEQQALEADLKHEDFYEMFGHVIAETYEELAGRSSTDLELVAWPKNPTGDSWKEEDLETFFPALSAKFGQ